MYSFKQSIHVALQSYSLQFKSYLLHLDFRQYVNMYELLEHTQQLQKISLHVLMSNLSYDPFDYYGH